MLTEASNRIKFSSIVMKMFICLVFLLPIMLFALPKLPININDSKSIQPFPTSDDDANCTVRTPVKKNSTLDSLGTRLKMSKSFKTTRSSKKTARSSSDVQSNSWKSIIAVSFGTAAGMKNQLNIENLRDAPKIFNKFVESIKEVLHDFEVKKNVNVNFEVLFENKGKLLRIDGDGESNTIADAALISLILCRVHHYPKMELLDRIVFIKCTYTKYPPKFAETKIHARQIEWIYPLLPGINTFEMNKNGVFLFPDLEALEELDKGAYGLVLVKDGIHYKQRKLSVIRKLLQRLISIVFSSGVKIRLKRQKREEFSADFLENLLKPENDLSSMAEEIHELREEAAAAAKATEGIEKTNATGDFWTQLCDKAVTILHYIMGIDMNEAKQAMNKTVGLARDLVNNLAIIKQSVDETQNVMKKTMKNIALNVMKNSFGQENVGLASDFLEMINYLEKTRKNLRALIG